MANSTGPPLDLRSSTKEVSLSTLLSGVRREDFGNESPLTRIKYGNLVARKILRTRTENTRYKKKVIQTNEKSK